MPEVRAVQAIATSVSDGAEGRYDKCVGIECFRDAWIRERSRRDLIRTRWATTDAVEHRVAKAREIIGYAVGAARIPNQNSVGLPSHERHLLGSIKVLSKR